MCQYCDQEFANGGKFCRFCGNNLENYHANQKIDGNVCSNCGNRILPGAAFCNACGNKVGSISQKPLPVKSEPEKFKNQKISNLSNNRKIIIICFACIGLFVIFSIIGGVLGAISGDLPESSQASATQTIATSTPETVSYQDQEFTSLYKKSSTDLLSLLNKALTSAENLDSDGTMIYSAGVIVAVENYKPEFEALRVSPAFEQSKYYYLKALDEISKAGYNYGYCGEYIGNYDYETATEYIYEGNKNVESATDYINKMV